MIRFNLQRFAGEKTERATPKRRQEARSEGNVPKSTDLTAAVGLVAILVVLRVFGPSMWRAWYSNMQTGLGGITTKPLTENGVSALFGQYLWMGVRMMAPLLGIALAVGLMTAFAQVGPNFVPKLLVPDLNRINPFPGMKRLFSPRSLVELAKSLLKLCVIGCVAYVAVSGITKKLPALMTTNVAAMVPAVGAIIFQLALQVSVLFLVLAFLDFLYQRFEYERSIRMSKEEIKQEHKNTEGDPLIKSKIRQRGRALALRRMMQEVPNADVIVTNPTHYSIALKYDSVRMSAPTVLAKGVDQVAMRIREIASEHHVPLVENRPLAQALYKTVELGEQVPAELFQAVAEVLAYVYRLKQSRP